MVVIRSRIRIPDYFSRHCGIVNFRFISISHRPIFTTLSEMADADKVMNPQHFVSDAADIRIRININPEIRIRILDHFWLRLDALVEVYCL